MLADPLVLNTAVTALTLGTPQSFVCSERAADHSTYRYVDGDKNDWIARVLHSYGRTRNRFTFRVDQTGVIPSVMVPSENSSFSQSCYVVYDCPNIGPIDQTTAVVNLARKAMVCVGSQLLDVAGDPVFLAKIVRLGET